MKRNILLAIIALLPVICFSANAEKVYKTLIGDYDVADEVKTVAKDSPAMFWKSLVSTNELLLKFESDIQKGKGAENEAIERLAKTPRFYPQYEEAIVEEMQGLCDTLLIDMGIAELIPNCSLHVMYSDDVNAFTVLTEDSFAMCVTTGLLSKKGINYDVLKGYIAHEFVHGVLSHHLRSFYAEAKRKRSDRLWGGISSALNVAAAAAQAYNAGMNGLEPSSVDYGSKIEKINEETKMSTIRYTYEYSREQEYEADLIAYRFMENAGKGEEFINGLRILGSEYDDLYDEFSDHPTTTSRIEFLKFVSDNPSLGNVQNKKLKEKRLKKERKR